MLPQDPIILLSYINTKLRDEFSSLDGLCTELGVDKEKLVQKLNAVNFSYDPQHNQFV